MLNAFAADSAQLFFPPTKRLFQNGGNALRFAVVSRFSNPALEAFLETVKPELIFAQVRIRRQRGGFELSHVDDETPEAALNEVASTDARMIAQYDANRAYRPLRSAPDLRRGWRVLIKDSEELWEVMNQLYPGALGDWFAVLRRQGRVTHYREFVDRQTGMYRITAMLTDSQAARVTRSCCAARFCLKRRCWTVEGLAPDAAPEKSLIPCLEPCAVLLEFARKGMRMEQREKVELALSLEELESLSSALERAINEPANVRAADLDAVDNPRRLQWVLEKIREAKNHLKAKPASQADSRAPD